MFWPIHTANLNAIKAMGRSDYFLKMEIAKKIIGMLLLLTTMSFGVMMMAYSLLISTVTSMIINSWPNKTLLGYSFKEQMIDIFPGVLLALIMGVTISNTVVDVARYCNTGYSNIGGCCNLYWLIGYL